MAGQNCLPMLFTERVCDVIPYSDECEAEPSVPIAQVATGFTTADGNCFILLFDSSPLVPKFGGFIDEFESTATFWRSHAR